MCVVIMSPLHFFWIVCARIDLESPCAFMSRVLCVVCTYVVGPASVLHRYRHLALSFR